MAGHEDLQTQARANLSTAYNQAIEDEKLIICGISSGLADGTVAAHWGVLVIRFPHMLVLNTLSPKETLSKNIRKSAVAVQNAFNSSIIRDDTKTQTAPIERVTMFNTCQQGEGWECAYQVSLVAAEFVKLYNAGTKFHGMDIFGAANVPFHHHSINDTLKEMVPATAGRAWYEERERRKSRKSYKSRKT
jgi:hypothetical protein